MSTTGRRTTPQTPARNTRPSTTRAACGRSTRYKEAAAVMQAAAVKVAARFRGARRIWQGARRQRRSSAGAGRAEPLLPARPAELATSSRCKARSPTGSTTTGSAQQFYGDALKIAPDEPAFLSNLGLSYALSKNLGLADETLRHAADVAARGCARPPELRAGAGAGRQVRRGRGGQPARHGARRSGAVMSRRSAT